jgi:hypothetical protein
MLQLVIMFKPVSIDAQFQEGNFSANDGCESYRCPRINGDTPDPSFNSTKEFCECNYTVDGETVTQIAYLKPPALQQIEIWFVRILYVIWAFVGSLSFLLLVYLGYQYMLTRGDVTKITYIRQRIINYGIGMVLVFLAVPILGTFFRVLGVNGDVQCYSFETLPRFQFFFPELCTDPKNVLVSDPCSLPDASGFACAVEGENSKQCQVNDGGGVGETLFYVCTSEKIWEIVSI